MSEQAKVTARQYVLLSMLDRHGSMAGRALRKMYLNRVRRWWPYSIVKFYVDMSALEDAGLVYHRDMEDVSGARGGARERWFYLQDGAEQF